MKKKISVSENNISSVDSEKPLTKEPPSIYVDTNFIIDCSEGRSRESILLMELIRSNGYSAISSSFSVMEISDVIKDEIFVKNKLHKHWTISRILRERYKKDLNSNDFENVREYVINKVLHSYPHLSFLNLSEDGWRVALEISAHSNVLAPDVIQVATAWNAGCKIFITSDDHIRSCIADLNNDFEFLKEIKVYTPSEFLKLIKK